MLRIAPPRRSSCSGEAAGTRVGSKRSGAPTSASRPVARAHSSKVVEQALHLQVGEREHVAQAAREQRPAVADRGEPADQRDAHRGERVEIERGPLGRADELRRRQTTGPRQVVDLVVALVPEPGGVHPPQHVAAAIRARQAHVLADRQRHGTPGLLDLGGELDAGRRSADDEDAALGQAIRVAVVERRDLRDRRRDAGGERRHARHVAGAAGEHDAPAADLAAAGADVVAVGRRPDGGDGGLGAHRRVRDAGEAIDEGGHLARRHVAVGLRAVVGVARQAALPVGREQAQRVPALAAPGVRHLPALEHEVVDRPVGEEPARGEAGMAGPDHDGA